jgi:hypothetical protein
MLVKITFFQYKIIVDCYGRQTVALLAHFGRTHDKASLVQGFVASISGVDDSPNPRRNIDVIIIVPSNVRSRLLPSAGSVHLRTFDTFSRPQKNPLARQPFTDPD